MKSTYLKLTLSTSALNVCIKMMNVGRERERGGAEGKGKGKTQKNVEV